MFPSVCLSVCLRLSVRKNGFGEQTSRVLEFKPEGFESYLVIYETKTNLNFEFLNRKLVDSKIVAFSNPTIFKFDFFLDLAHGR